MGILGTTKSEEEALRAAAAASTNNRFDSRSSLDASASSAYETASEYESVDFETPAHAQGVAQPEEQRDSGLYAHNLDSESASTIHAAPVQKETNAEADTDDEIHSLHEPDYTHLSENELNRIETERSLSVVASRVFSKGQSVHLKDLEYDGPNDMANPHNWPSWKKWLATTTIANTCLCISLGSSLYVEGVPELVEQYGVSQTLAISGLSLYLLGLALGPIVGAPLSELIGRRLVYITTFPVAMLFAMGVGLSQNIWSVLILRFFVGLVASPPMAIAGGSITDIWAGQPEQMSTAMALFCLSPFLGPVIGPIIGGFVAENKSWRWTMWVSLMFSGAILPFLLWCPETFKPAILRRRAKARGIHVIEPELSFQQLLQTHLFRPFEILFVEPIVGLSSIYTAFVFAVLFGFFEAFPIIFRGTYGMSTGVSGLPFIGVGVGLCAAVLIFIIIDKVKYFPKNPDGTRGRRDENGNLIWDAPESRLLIAEMGAFLLPIALFWLAWTSRKSIHWIAPSLSAVPFGAGLLWIFFGVVLYYSMSFPPAYVASALAANNLLRYLVAGAFPLFMVQMYEKLHVDWATSLLAFIALAMVPIPFAFHKWGGRLRLRSKYGYVAMFRKMAEAKAAAAAAAAEQAPEPKEVSEGASLSDRHSQSLTSNDVTANKV